MTIGAGEVTATASDSEGNGIFAEKREEPEAPGTTGRSLRVEAVHMRLTGELGNGYSVWYRVHSQNKGWLGWTCDGQDAGTYGLSLRAEAVDVQMLPKGQVPRGYDGSAACVTR